MINLFNWKKYPANVLILAIPLASLGLGLMILLAYLHWKIDGDFVYSLIVLGGIGLLCLGLTPVWPELKKNV